MIIFIRRQLGNDPSLDGVYRGLNSTFLLKHGRLTYPRFHAVVQAQRLNGKVSIALAPAVPIDESQRVVHHKTLGDCPEVLKCINDACDPAGLFLIVERLSEHHVAVRQCGAKQLAMLNAAVVVDPWQKITGKVDFHALTGHSLNIAADTDKPVVESSSGKTSPKGRVVVGRNSRLCEIALVQEPLRYVLSLELSVNACPVGLCASERAWRVDEVDKLGIAERQQLLG